MSFSLLIMIVAVSVALAWITYAYAMRKRAVERRKFEEAQCRVDALVEEVRRLSSVKGIKDKEELRKALDQQIGTVLRENQEEQYSRNRFTRELLDAVDPTRVVRSSVDKGNGQRKVEPPTDKPDRWQARIGRILEDEENEVQELRDGDEEEDSPPKMVKISGKLYVRKDTPVSPAQKSEDDQETKDQIKKYWSQMGLK